VNQHYKITSKVLGVGTKSEVRLGYSTLHKRNVAVKVIELHSLSEDEKALVRKESFILKKVSALNQNQFVAYLDSVEDASNLYIITELINGVELLDFCSSFKAGMSHSLVKRIFLQIVNCVNQLHQNHICHLDLKLENIMYIRYLNRIKLIDFGFSNTTTTMAVTETSFNHENSSRESTDILQTHYCGTLHYSPPEVLKYQPYDGKKADAWSLGIILYSMINMCYPFDDENNDFSLISKKIINENVALSDHLSSSLKALLSSLLSKDPAKRLSVSEIAEHPWFSD